MHCLLLTPEMSFSFLSRVTQLFSGFNALQAIYLNHRPSPELLPKDPALLKSTAINPLNTKGKKYQFYNGA